mmetsp:Transcript_18442/g.22636  ORF Transcript_18442/g.22636 Transcript_18442/m.22636 type:complete len:336 (-) Transcript_18442:557-1564(-)
MSSSEHNEIDRRDYRSRDEGSKDRDDDGGDGRRQERNGVSLLIKNLSYHVQKHHLQERFESYGRILDVHIPVDYHSREPRGFGFVEMSNREEAERAVQALDQSLFEGRHIKVIFAQQTRRNPHEMAKAERERRHDDRISHRSDRRNDRSYDYDRRDRLRDDRYGYDDRFRDRRRDNDRRRYDDDYFSRPRSRSRRGGDRHDFDRDEYERRRRRRSRDRDTQQQNGEYRADRREYDDDRRSRSHDRVRDGGSRPRSPSPTKDDKISIKENDQEIFNQSRNSEQFKYDKYNNRSESQYRRRVYNESGGMRNDDDDNGEDEIERSEARRDGINMTNHI